MCCLRLLPQCHVPVLPDDWTQWAGIPRTSIWLGSGCRVGVLCAEKVSKGEDLLHAGSRDSLGREGVDWGRWM